MYRLLKLSGEHGAGLRVKIDAEDFDRCAEHNWFALTRKWTTYAYCNLPRDGDYRTTMLLHRFIMRAPSGVKVDHRNGNGLDNRQANLRLATSAQNAANRRDRPRGITPSGYGGWVARIRHEGRNLYLGTFETEIEAETAYQAAALELRGEFHSCTGT
jgi:hypothetical protein